MNEEASPLLSEQQQRADKENPFTLYKDIVVGEGSWIQLFLFEAITGIGSLLPGLLGLAFRSGAYSVLFRQSAGRPYVGKGVTLRNPGGVELGKKVFLDDFVTLDCRKGSKISLDDHVVVGRTSILAAKGGDIELARGVNIGSSARIATQGGVVIGEGTLIAAYAYIGPGNHHWDEKNQAFISGDMELKGGVSIGRGCWIGTRATILDGVTVGDNAVIGAHSLVKEDVPPKAIVAGVPSKIIGEVGK